MQPQPIAQKYLAGLEILDTLNGWATFGVEVEAGPDWSNEAIMQAIQDGPH
jgi:hypothetical protein